MFPNNRSYPTVRVASEKKILELSGKKKMSGAAIKAAYAANPGIEFIDAVTGQWTTVAEAKAAGATALSIRYNQDRDVFSLTC